MTLIMKSIIRKVATNTLALFILTQLIAGVSIANGASGIVLAGIVLTIISFIATPVINIIGIPFRVVSFGFFPLLVNAVLLFLLTLVMSGVNITAFFFPGLQLGGFIVPKMFFNPLFAFLASSVVFSATVFAVNWITD